MVLELVKAVFIHPLNNVFYGFRSRRNVRRVERLESRLSDVIKSFSQIKYAHGGLIEYAKKDAKQLIALVEKQELQVLKLEESSTLHMRKAFNIIFKSLKNARDLGNMLSRAEQFTHNQEVQQIHQEIAQTLEQDVGNVTETTIKLARIVRDQYDSLAKTAQGEEAQARLRDIAGTITVFLKDMTERRGLQASARTIKALGRDEKAEEREIKHLRADLAQKNFKEEKFLRELQRTKKTFLHESAQINQYLKKAELSFQLIARHYFTTLEQIHQIQENVIGFLEKDGYSKNALNEIILVLDKTITHLQERSKIVMREMYQLHNEMHKLGRGSEQVQHEQKNLRKAA